MNLKKLFLEQSLETVKENMLTVKVLGYSSILIIQLMDLGIGSQINKDTYIMKNKISLALGIGLLLCPLAIYFPTGFRLN